MQHDEARSNADSTSARLSAWLAQAPVVPGSVAASAAPLAALRNPGLVPVSDHLVARTRCWIAPGSPSAALDYLGAHLPRGWRVQGQMDGGGTQGLMIEPVPVETTGFTHGSVLYTVAQDADRTAIRLDAWAIWLPPRPPGSLIDDATSVAVVLDRQGALPTVRRTLTGPPAAALAAQLNGLSVQPSGVSSCPADQGWVDRLSFTTPAGVVTAVVAVSGCSHVQIGDTSLDGASEVNAAATADLGLPGGYLPGAPN